MLKKIGLCHNRMQVISIFSTKPQNFTPDLEVSGCFCECHNKVLFLKRNKEKSQGNKWSIPGGKLEKGETPRSAAIRELFEETKIDIQEDLNEIGKLYVILPEVKYVFHMFRKVFSSFPHFIVNLEEHSEGEWKTLEEAFELPLIVGGKETILAYQKNLSQEI